MSYYVLLIEAVKAEGFNRGGVVAAAFGGVQVAGVFDGPDDGSPDDGQVGRPAAGTAGRGVFAENHVADLVVRLGGPVLADQAGQVLRGGVGAGEASDGVDGLAGDLPCPEAGRLGSDDRNSRGGVRLKVLACSAIHGKAGR